MMRWGILAACIAAAAAFNCAGSLSIDCRYCTTIDQSTGEPYCDAAGIEIGDTVPLRLRGTNAANYENEFYDSVGVPGEIQSTKRLQIVFSCATAAATSRSDRASTGITMTC